MRAAESALPIGDGELESGEDGKEVSDLLAQIKAAFPNFPEEASLVVTGTFTPTGGQPVPFTVFVRAEIEVKLKFDPPLVVTADNRSVTVTLTPASWFKRPDGSVLDLSQFDFEKTHRVPELEALMRDTGYRPDTPVEVGVERFVRWYLEFYGV